MLVLDTGVPSRCALGFCILYRCESWFGQCMSQGGGGEEGFDRCLTEAHSGTVAGCAARCTFRTAFALFVVCASRRRVDCCLMSRLLCRRAYDPDAVADPRSTGEHAAGEGCDARACAAELEHGAAGDGESECEDLLHLGFTALTLKAKQIAAA